MKNQLLKRILSLLLVVAMLAGFYVPGAQAASAGVTWKESDQKVSLDLTERKAEIRKEEPYAPTDIVRVSIVMEEKSTLQAGFSTHNIAANAQALAYNRGLRDKQEIMAQTISNQVLGGKALDVVWNLTLVGNMISANVPYGKIDAIAQVDGVAAVVLETIYEPCVVDQGTVADPQMYSSLRMTGSSLVWSSGYTGAGSRVAVIDTGTDTDHQSLDADAFLYSLRQNAAAAGVSFDSYLANLDLLDTQEIASVLTDLNIYQMDSSLTAAKLYLNEKLPFAVNYVDGDGRRLVVDHERDDQGEHGSHVAGIVTANRYIPNGNGYVDALSSVMVAGAAPDAQLITMKVFGYYGGPSDGDYLAAVEDAILLGCDAVNLSLGSGNPGATTNEYYASILAYLTTTDTVVVASAGNSSYWAEQASYNYLYSQDVNMHTGGSPGTYYSFLNVASVDNDGGMGPAFRVGDRIVGYSDASHGYYNDHFSSLDTSPNRTGTDYEYIFIDGAGKPEDYAGMDLTGKIVFCSRGENNLADKANNAVSRGAAATVIYNNEPGMLNLDLSGYSYNKPCVGIAKVEADAIRNMSQKKLTSGGLTYYTGTLTVLSQYQGITYNSEYLTMSSYSSWGVPDDLSLKPEITAPGGYIYSIYGETPYGGGPGEYEIMSGTSMASPAVAGMAALIAQYVRENGLAEQEGMSTRALVQSLLMSTAVPMREESSGSYYSLLQQGSGLARADLATSADSYILVEGQNDGRVKAELGDDPNRTGVYEFSFSINNLTDRPLFYALSADLFRQGIYNGAYSFMNLSTTELPGTVTFTANGATITPQSDLSGCDLNGDGSTDAADADHLLEYVVGNVVNLYGNGDLSGDGAVTSYDAHVLLERINSNSGVTVPAGGSVTVDVCITLTQSAKATLNSSFENGTFVQAFVYAESAATAEGVAGTTHSIPMLAFYGDWSDPSMFDHGSYVELKHDYDGLTPYLRHVANGGSGNGLTIDYGDGDEYYFGGNPVSWGGTYRPERNAFNNQGYQRLAYQYFSLIRAAADVQLVISNADTGAVYMRSDLGQHYPAYFYVNGGSWLNVEQYADVNWYGTDAYGNRLPEGTRVEVSLVAAPAYYRSADGSVNFGGLSEGAYLTTQLTIDNTEPDIHDMRLNGSTLTVTAHDNQYVAGAILYDSYGNPLAYATADQSRPGTEVTMELDLSYVGGTNFQLAVYDYASNEDVQDVTLDLPEPDRPYFTVVDYPNNTYYGLDADGSSVVRATSDRGLIDAAEYVDGYVFEITNGGYLYYGSDENLYTFRYMTQLDAYYSYDVTNFLDLAYNYADGKLYGLFYARRNNQSYPYLCTIDMNTGAWEVLYELPVDVNNMAIDGDGNFYSVTYNAPYLYTYTLDDLDNDTMHYVGYMSGFYTSQRNSMAWDHNTDTLYWAYPGILLEVDHTTGAVSEVSDFDYVMTGLYIRPGNGSRANGLSIQPVENNLPEDYSPNVNTDVKASLESKVSAAPQESETEHDCSGEHHGGGVNSVVNYVRNTVDPQSSGDFDSDNGNIVVTLTSGKDSGTSTNGRMTVTYNPWELELVNVSGNTPAFAYSADNGTVEVAYATGLNVRYDDTVAVLTFKPLENSDYEITVRHTEDGSSPFNKEESLTVAPGCVHNYQSVVIAPTCTENGYTEYTCTLCGDSYVRNVTPAMGHYYVGSGCTRCGDGFASLELVSAPDETSYAIGDELDLTGVVVNAYYENGGSLQLTAEDLQVLSCDMSTVGVATAYVGIGQLSVTFPVYVHASRITVTLDPSTYPESDHDYDDNLDDWQTVSYPGASSLTLVFSINCYVESGYDNIYVYDGNENLIAQYTGSQAAGAALTVPGDIAQIRLTSDSSYSDYGYSFTSITASALEHTGESVGNVPPTCTEPGHTDSFRCEICGQYCGGGEIPPLGHDYHGVYAAPTCEEDGGTIYTCSRCGDRYVENLIPAPGHDYVGGICTRCGDGVVSLELVSEPTVTSYAIGDTLQLNGILVRGYMEDGDYMELTAEDLTVFSCNMSTVGVSTAYVGVGELRVSFPVYVHAGRINQELDPATYPESDHDYEHNADDWQTVSYPGAASLTLVFSDETEVENNYDFIYVLDGDDNEVARYTGSQAAGVSLTVPGDTAQIRLTSDYSYSGYGYSFTSISASVVEHTGESPDFRYPTCTEPGYTGDFDCEICGEHVEGRVIPAWGHTFTDWFYNDYNELVRVCGTCDLVEKLDVDRLFTVAGESSNPDLSMEQMRQLYAQVDWGMFASYVTPPSVSAPYVAGRLTDECLDNLVAQVNFFRAIARLDNVGWAEEYVNLTQHATVVNAANGVLTHYPTQPADMDDAFYNLGYRGASSSNIAMGYGLMGSVLGYLEDSDSSNIDRVGHRRWVLNPYMANTGFGYTGRFSAMYAFDTRNTTANFDFVGFPGGSSVFPNEFFDNYYAWSTHLSRNTFQVPSLDELRVTLIRESDGREWVFDANTTGSGYYYFNLDTGGYGNAMAIIFRPDGVTSYQGVYTVRITGLRTRAGETAAIEYSVNFQSIESQGCDHTPVVRGAYDATCTEPGYTGDTYCADCGELIAAGQVIPATGHQYGSWYQTVAPGCETAGQERRDCDACGHYETRTVDPLGHDYRTVVTAPTCEEGGYTTYTCARCGDSYVADRTDPLGHDYRGVVTAPTCEEGGYTIYTCNRCNHSYVGNYTDPLGHDYDAVVTAPTCTQKGYTTYTCGRCGHSYVGDYTDALGHDYRGVVTAPTCEEGGYTTYTCARCSHSYVGDHTDPLGHNYTSVVTEPTCEEGGYTTYTCTVCDHSYEGNHTDPLGHIYEDGHCSRCGEEEYTVRWYSGTTSLKGTIDLNMYVILSENLVNDPETFVRFTFDYRVVDVPMAEAQPYTTHLGEQSYRFSCPLFAKQVADQIVVQVMRGETPVGEPMAYSAMQYCKNLIRKNQDPEQVAMCKAMLNYATAAQLLFNYNTDNLANASLSEADKNLPDVDASAFKYTVSNNQQPGIKAKSATMMMESEIRIRVYFELKNGHTIDEYTFTIDGVEVQPQQNADGWFIESEGILAKEMENMHDFCFGGITVHYGALSYVNSKLKSNDPLEVNLAKALYAYYIAAEALLG